MPSLPPHDWASEIGRRIRWHLALKVAGTTCFTWLFFIGYFELLRHPVYPVTVMPLTAFDRLVPFNPDALVPYVSLWVYVGLAPALQKTHRELLNYAFWVGSLCLAGLAFFYFWPTVTPPLGLPTTDAVGFAMLKGLDAAGNACPSMHVAAALFTAIRVHDVLRQVGVPASVRALNAGWFLAIAFSTLATRQHVVLDGVAGAALGAAFALASLHWRAVAGLLRARESGAASLARSGGPAASVTADEAPSAWPS
jgi:hypothetical protein